MKTLLSVLLLFVAVSLNAQTSTELIGKWKLVSWKTKKGKEKDIKDYFKTDQVFQVFKEDGKFESVIDDKIHNGKWKLSGDNKELTVESMLIPTTFSIDYFDSKKRIISTPQLGTLEYTKVSDE